MTIFNLGIFSSQRVRLIRQTEVAECGLASLAMIASFHGLEIDLGTMRRRFEPSMRGTSLRTLLKIADQLEFVPRPVKASLDHLEKLHLPAILHWNLNHFVVVERVTSKAAMIHDPNGRSGWMQLSEVSLHFTGVALELRPSSVFKKGVSKQRLQLSELWTHLSGIKDALAQTFLLSFVLQLLSLIAPYYLQIAVDSALPALDSNLLIVLAVGFGLVAVFGTGTTLLRAFGLLHAGTTMSIGLKSNVVRHLHRLPISWFEKRHSGDILSRVQAVGPIQKLLTEDSAVAVVDGALAIFTFCIMLYYSAALAILALIAFAIQCAIRLAFYPAQRAAEEAKIVASGREQTSQIETLRGIRTIRLFNREAYRYLMWQTLLIDVANADIRISRIVIWRSTATLLIFSLENVISIWLAISFVMKGAGFSLGMVFAFMAYKLLFTKKSEAMVDQIMSFRMLELYLSRLSDIVHAKEDVGFVDDPSAAKELFGRIELKNLSYRYSSSDPWVLYETNAVFGQGEHIAITGPSGGGKSTLVKILTGLILPTNGEVFVDGIPLKQFGLRNFQQQIAAVLQDDSLFAGSLAENIGFFDEHIDMESVVLVAKAAAIHDDIMAMHMQYETLVGDMGSTLSGGQKQRLLLARALYRKPRILIMDEGTAHLDSINEAVVDSAIKEMGITRIIIAHRKETISAASRVLLMSGGKLTEVD